MFTDKKYLKEIGKRVESMRNLKGLTLVELAKICDRTTEEISQLESGEEDVTMITMLHIAEALGISLKDLMVEY